jgi:hypothetical protein
MTPIVRLPLSLRVWRNAVTVILRVTKEPKAS